MPAKYAFYAFGGGGSGASERASGDGVAAIAMARLIAGGETVPLLPDDIAAEPQPSIAWQHTDAGPWPHGLDGLRSLGSVGIRWPVN